MQPALCVWDFEGDFILQAVSQPLAPALFLGDKPGSSKLLIMAGPSGDGSLPEVVQKPTLPLPRACLAVQELGAGSRGRHQ